MNDCSRHLCYRSLVSGYYFPAVFQQYSNPFIFLDLTVFRTLIKKSKRSDLEEALEHAVELIHYLAQILKIKIFHLVRQSCINISKKITNICLIKIFN